MNSGGAVSLAGELVVVGVAVAVLVLIALGFWLYVHLSQRPPHVIVQLLAVFYATACLAVLIAAASGFFPGAISINSGQLGPFTLNAKGQLAVFIVAVAIFFSGSGVLFILVKYFFPDPQARKPEPEKPRVKVAPSEVPEGNREFPNV